MGGAAMKHTEGTFKGFEDCNLYFQSWHPAPASEAIVVLIHGLGGHSGILGNVVEYLVPQGYEVYAMDLRGHGRSQGQRGHINHWQEFREDLRIFLQQIRQQQAHCPLILWGHSLGGTIVLDYALRFPDQLQGLIVSAPALSKISVPAPKLLIGQLLSQVLPHFSLTAGLAKSLATRDQVALAAQQQDPLRHEWGTARLVTEFFSTVDWINYHAAELRVPLLIMHGTADGVTSPEGSRDFFERVLLPDKEHHEYPGAYHDLYDDLDRMTMFNDVEVWLDRHLETAEHCQPYSACLLVHQSLPSNAVAVLGKTLPALLDAACEQHPNAKAFNQWTSEGWQTWSNQALQQQVEAVALGLPQLGLSAGDGLGLTGGERVAFLMQSNVHFAIADLGCLLAQFVDVPIDLTQTLEHIVLAIRHSSAKALIVTNVDLLTELTPYLVDLPDLRWVIVAEVPPDWAQVQGTIELPSALQITSLETVQALGEAQRSPAAIAKLRQVLQPDDLATIIYIPSPTGELLGVPLTHENIAGNALATFGELPDLGWGDAEVALAFLPLTHIFARHLLYGHIYYGHSVYFSDSRHVIKHLQELRPTVLATVPVLLEKVYQQIRDRGNKLKSRWARIAFAWALGIAQRHQLGQPIDRLYPKLLKVADRAVLRHWRSLFGGRLKYLLSGGAALKAEVTNVLTAAGIPILQGYGLTQSGGVVCFNRPDFNRAGTVGSPIPGVELAIAPDQEVLVRGPYITAGYYHNPAATADLIDAEGWLHTGDFGSMTIDGQLQITGMKKPLFKLSTGKYIAPQPIESRLQASPLVAHVMLVGADRQYCAALIFPNLPILRDQAKTLNLTDSNIVRSDVELLKHPCILGWYQAVVDAANCHLPYWSMVKRFRLVNLELTIDNGLLNRHQEIHRYRLNQKLPLEIAALYGEELPPPRQKQLAPAPDVPRAAAMPTISCPTPPAAACPAAARSLHPRFTT
jgi:long-chain acyl-CoA synthetase